MRIFCKSAFGAAASSFAYGLAGSFLGAMANNLVETRSNLITVSWMMAGTIYGGFSDTVDRFKARQNTAEAIFIAMGGGLINSLNIDMLYDILSKNDVKDKAAFVAPILFALMLLAIQKVNCSHDPVDTRNREDIFSGLNAEEILKIIPPNTTAHASPEQKKFTKHLLNVYNNIETDVRNELLHNLLGIIYRTKMNYREFFEEFEINLDKNKQRKMLNLLTIMCEKLFEGDNDFLQSKIKIFKHLLDSVMSEKVLVSNNDIQDKFLLYLQEVQELAPNILDLEAAQEQARNILDLEAPQVQEQVQEQPRSSGIIARFYRLFGIGVETGYQGLLR